MRLLVALSLAFTALPCGAASVRTPLELPALPSPSQSGAVGGSLGLTLLTVPALGSQLPSAATLATPALSLPLLPTALPAVSVTAGQPRLGTVVVQPPAGAAQPWTAGTASKLPAARSQAGIAGRAPEAAAVFDGGKVLSDIPVEAGAPDLIPEWPGKTGDTVRLNGRSYVLGEKLGEGTSAWVYKVQGRPLVVKLIYPDLKDIPVFGHEREALEAMSRTRIAYARLHDSSADGMTLVKDLVKGEEMWKVTDKGPLSPAQKESLLELAAELVAIGHTADLNWGNLLWDGTRWVMIDAGGFQKVGPWGPLGQILSEERRTRSGIDAGAFLRALRARLGPGSEAWRGVVTGAAWPYQKAILAELD